MASKSVGAAPVNREQPPCETYSPVLLKPRVIDEDASKTRSMSPRCQSCGATEDISVPGGWRGVYHCNDFAACQERVEAKCPRCHDTGVIAIEAMHRLAEDNTYGGELVGLEPCQCMGVRA
jgi:hypothetical protein